MLQRPGHDLPQTGIPIAEAKFPSPFPGGLEYSCPARGTWNIVHTGFLIPEAHQIFVCAGGCLRGVVLTAAEMGAQERFSTITVEEHNVIDGDMEQLILDGVGDILSRLPALPPAVLLYTSCIHHFMGCDLALVYRTLRERYPAVDFTDCYMNPILRKSGLTPDQTMRKQLYAALPAGVPAERAVNLIGSDFALDETSDLAALVRRSGYALRQLPTCKTYADYQKMASSALEITVYPAAKVGGEALAERLGRKHLHLPYSVCAAEIKAQLALLADALGVTLPDLAQREESASRALDEAQKTVGNTPVCIDYTFCPRPLGLARLLLAHSFSVVSVYLDAVSGEEEDDFRTLQREAPGLMFFPTTDAAMRVHPRGSAEKTLALGQKAAYFADTPYFVNLVQGSGMYGFDGITRLAALMREAFLQPKNPRLIQIKGLGTSTCCG